MRARTAHYLLVVITVSIYLSFSMFIFDKVNEASHTVIDELFHLPQGKAYCEKNFTYWDKKITTLPGLYLVSSYVGYVAECTTYNLRFVNLLASTINLLLLSSILNFIYGNHSENKVKIVLQSFNIAILPPLYFFSHVYYTDTLSLTFLLAYSRCTLMGSNKLVILVLGLCSVIMRQTNIVWIAMVFGHRMLDVLIKTSRVFGNQYLTNVILSKHSLIAEDIDESKLKRYYGMYDVYVAVCYHVRTCFLTFFKYLTLNDWLFIATHLALLGSFLGFVVWNGSIVVGDKSAHVATLHVPQMFYFLLFYGVFGLHYVLSKLPSTFQLMYDNKLRVVFLLFLFSAVVHFNTIVHPYLLADNRHYTFYIWNRWFGKYDYAIYASVPVYVFLLFSLYDNLRLQNGIAVLLPYTLCTFFVLSLQKMIEVRYFLVPYIVLRLRFGRQPFKLVIFELLWYLALNFVTFNIFFTKQIMWKDFDYGQRIIW